MINSQNIEISFYYTQIRLVFSVAGIGICEGYPGFTTERTKRQWSGTDTIEFHILP